MESVSSSGNLHIQVGHRELTIFMEARRVLHATFFDRFPGKVLDWIVLRNPFQVRLCAEIKESFRFNRKLSNVCHSVKCMEIDWLRLCHRFVGRAVL